MAKNELVAKRPVVHCRPCPITCPSLPGLATYGETLEEARAMAADAIEGYLECLEEDGLPLPESDPVAVPPLVDQIRVKLASK